MPRTAKRTATALTAHWTVDIGDYVTALAWAPDGQHLAAAASNGEIAIISGESGETLRTFVGHQLGTLDLAWRSDGQVIASAGQDGLARLWGGASGKELAVLEGGASWVEHLAWSPSAPVLATASGKHLKFWGDEGALLHHSDPHASTISSLVWNAAGDCLASICYGQVLFWQVGQANPDGYLECQDSLISVAWSPNGRYIACGSQGASVYVWNLQSEFGHELSGYPSKVRAVDWSSRSRYLATSGSTDVSIWSFTATKMVQSEPIVLAAHDRLISALAFQPWGPLLASGGDDGAVKLWSPARKRPLASVSCEAPVSQLSWQPNDQVLISGDADGIVRAWRSLDVQT